jgi:hypothetical protein
VQCKAWGLGRFGDILGCFREGLGVLLKHFIKRFWEGVLLFFWYY